MIDIDSLDDPRLAAYRSLKDKELARDGRRFIAEGEQVVRRLLASKLTLESILVARRKAAAIAAATRDVPTYSAADSLIEQIIGFEFHSGVLAVGVRPENVSLDELVGHDARRTLVVCPKITNVENLGSLVRIAAAFGVTGMILGEQCCDPFFRQSVRVSMGSVFVLPMRRTENVLGDLARLRNDWGFDRLAAVLSPQATPLANATRSANLALLFGGEADGLDHLTISACDRQVGIPMRLGTDSLNVSVAAGIMLYHFVDVCAGGE